MNVEILEAHSTLTDRFQTTVPEPVRRVLNLNKRDKIQYTVLPNGDVTLSKVVPAESDAEDPVLGSFLAFMANDMQKHPEKLHALDSGLVSRIQALVADVDFDLDAPLSADDE